jgi:hypothetical protein
VEALISPSLNHSYEQFRFETRRYFMRIKNFKALALAAVLPSAMMLSAPAEAVFTIDDFDVDTSVSVEDTTTGIGGVGGTPNSGSPNIEGIVMNKTGGAAGWTRSLYAELLKGDSVETVDCAACKAGHIVNASGVNPDGTNRLSSGLHYFDWEGPSTDLSGYSVAEFLWSSDAAGQGTQAWWEFIDNTGTATATTAKISLNADTILTKYSTALTAFGADADKGYEDITKIKLWFDTSTSIGGGGVDGNVRNAQLVPEPETIALLGIGLVSFALRRRRSATSIIA